ncbi:hypothetical protein FRC0290_01321 [Corynebacterium diphtheriae]|nr:hypothetical protein FRC0290_01321 [Corynebacterium diphtheriae]CAB0996325.1 hypothetical protein FRC0497_01354 [Corynebacterium diphtheriae]CAB1018059.1 hypothetical protein FRC0534_01429 [Corynebacterium diphtheriae]
MAMSELSISLEGMGFVCVLERVGLVSYQDEI